MANPLKHLLAGHHVTWFRISRVLTILLLVGVIWDPMPGLLTEVMQNNIAVIFVLAALASMTIALTYDFLTRTQKDWRQLIGKYLFLMWSVILLFGMLYLFLQTNTADSGLRSEFEYVPERDAFYFSAITYYTVGFGDYNPYGVAKMLSMIEAMAGTTINLVVLAIALTRLKPPGSQQAQGPALRGRPHATTHIGQSMQSGRNRSTSPARPSCRYPLDTTPCRNILRQT